MGDGARGTRRRRDPAEDRRWEEDLDAVAAALRAGRSPEVAWGAVGVACSPEGIPSPDRSPPAVLAAARLSAELGAPPADLLESCARSLVREREAEARRRAAMAAPQATARLLLALPLVGPLLGLALGVDTAGVLLSGRGLVLGAGGALLLAAGHLWAAREVRAAVAAGEAP